ncbi:uncharacterized protein LOC110462223 [Mizuhopecten yessoensis]|uniref:Uncharacterized protein n=1 Tax=Mizuhopecten yessoensis TaxID=6573 RepID=A0A210PYH2_MIZYE|nr:uncharacterized protein LOC110462223 [Mizuhopecten yessoensis]OWF41531.1 hypothetical protein KP79_PYT11884 [Mizuhopecten yessoensis]
MSDLTDEGAKTSVNKRARDLGEDGGPSESCHLRRRKCNIGLCDSRDSYSEKNHLFSEIPERILKGVTRALERLLVDNFASRIVRLTPLKLLNCNAADLSMFSNAYCSVVPFENVFSLWSVFQKGTNLLMNFIDADPDQEARITKLPGNKQEEFLLDKLLHYLVETDQQYQGEIESPLADLDRKSEADLTIILANHLFGRLAISSNYLLDKQSKEKERGKYQTSCPCGTTSQCTLTGRFGDTSLGNGLVWHDNLDAVIDHQVILVTQEEEGELQESPGGTTPVGMKQDSRTKISRYQQNIARTITFSFLQKQRHPDNEHFLFPCIGITNADMAVYLYDSEHDILLESSKIPLHESEGQTNLLAVIISWLVINYKYTCNG